MTKINRMVMRGFKSFGEKTSLIFGDTFNCVLGPNGSGKSNIMDALCFVLGKGSAKGLRAEKSANLIYNGGKTKKPAKEGEVAIYFDNASKIFPVDAEEVKISRMVRQNGQSIYKINDKRHTRVEILDLLGRADIDPNGYNIILQGDIVRFVEMSTVDRRQIIEEIAGIGVYEEKKNKALRELDKVEQKLGEAEIILTERKTYLKELRKERDQAAKYKDLSDKINRNKATYLNKQIAKKNKEKSSFDTNIKDYNEKIAKKQGTIDKNKEVMRKNKEIVQGINKEIEEKGEKEQVVLLKEIEGLKVNIGTNKNRVGICKNEIERIAARKSQLDDSVKELKNKVGDLEKEKEAFEKERGRIGKELLQLENKIEEFRKKNKLEGAEDIDKEIMDIDKEAEEKQKNIQELRETQQDLLREKDRVEYQIATIDEKISKVLELEKENKAEIEKLKQMQKEFKKATLELNQVLQEDSSLAAQLGNARQNLNIAKEEEAKLEARNTSIREHAAGGIATQKIMENKNKFGEVFGTVSELGNVSSKYALALEVAAGPKLKSIVVDSDKTAAECIKFLKRNQLGIATFLPLNKIKTPKPTPGADKFAKVNGSHGFATKLISSKPKFAPVFKYVFGDTIVVDNIDVARRIGIGNVRMATLDGDMAELSGAMVGGFREKKRKGMGFQEKEVAEGLKKIQKEIMDNEALIANIEKKRKSVDDKITRLRELKATLEGDIIKKERSLHLEEGDVGVTRKAKKELMDQSDDLDKRLTTLGLQISEANKGLAQLKIKKEQLREKITKLRNPRLVAELNTFEQKKTELREENIKLEGNVRNIEMQIRNILKPENENIIKIIKQHDKEEDEFKEEIKTLKQKIVEEEKRLKEKEKKQEQFYGKFKELYLNRDKANEAIQAVELKIIKEEEQIRGIEHRMNALSIENARVKAELSGLNEEYKRYEGVELYTNKSEEDLRKEIAAFERMADNFGSVNMKALEIYDNVERQYNKLLEKRETLKDEKEEVLVMMNEIETKKKEMFLQTFEVIDKHFQEMFTSLSTKGEAFLELENEKDPLSEGVAIKVRITGKKFLDIRSLSGGEKTLTALAFIFSIQEHEPASFYVFDEVDAALDKRNSEKLAKLIEKYAGKAQYIIISHNDGIISEADTLYGVSMRPDNMSKVVSLKV